MARTANEKTNVTSSPVTDPDGRLVVVGPDGGALSTSPSTITTATRANVASSASSVALFASNTAARQRAVFNDSTAILYLAFGSAAASATSHTVQIAAGAYYEFPLPLYTGAVTGIWASANGSARTTEVTA